MFDLKNTVNMMLSEDYKDRFTAEYFQTFARYMRLKRFCNKIEAAQIKNVPEPEHDCPLPLLREQQRAMGEYLKILELRAEIENVDIYGGIYETEDKV